ncbi:M28 family peptidase, partial [candidate division KSB1 bacterium]|nr:M28 family peptidase [candidate division KSB1 bacterium]
MNNEYGKSVICMIFIIGLSSLYAQEYDPFIADLVNQTCIDSLVRYVRILSGEESVWLGGAEVLIRQRVDSDGRALAAAYIKQKLQSYGLDTFEQIYSQSGKNIYARQAGTLDENPYSIICAHYDAVTYYCADDNASSVAAVLEAARLLSRYQSDYTIVYALWDQEEIDLNGSRYYANQAAANDHDIRGVLNLEMLGWDSNNDGLFDIHTKNVANSVALANLLVHLVSVYDFPLDPTVYNPGSPDSDHSPFWQKGFGAICQSQAYWGGDFNPYYHSSQDRINKFNLTFFLQMSKLSIAAIATLSSIKSPVYADLDFGDAPDDGPGAGPGEYNTCLSDDGPRHMIFSERIRLGEIIDAET